MNSKLVRNGFEFAMTMGSKKTIPMMPSNLYYASFKSGLLVLISKNLNKPSTTVKGTQRGRHSVWGTVGTVLMSQFSWQGS